MYEIENNRARCEVRKNLEQAKALVENARDWLVRAKQAAPDERYLGYDMDDGDYALARISKTLDECIRETEVVETSDES